MIIKNEILKRTGKKSILWDAFFDDSIKEQPLVIFCHGYKGFKDWGAWNRMAELFMDNGLAFVKFNFSHNGGTMDDPIDFPDLDAFAKNTYSKELEDLNDILNFFTSQDNPLSGHIHHHNITLIGHSRGGGICIIKGSEDSRVTKIVTWASVSDFGKRSSTTGDLEKWKQNGVKYVLNGRTKQQMPHNFQFYEDFKNNEKRLHIESAVKRLAIPHLIIHGKEDNAVSFSEAALLHKWNPQSKMVSIEKANHVFNTKHPWRKRELPVEFTSLIEHTLKFITD